MTQQQFEELKSLLQANYELLVRIYEENGGQLQQLDGRLTPVEVGKNSSATTYGRWPRA
jgi:hypothetical protein